MITRKQVTALIAVAALSAAGTLAASEGQRMEKKHAGMQKKHAEKMERKHAEMRGHMKGHSEEKKPEEKQEEHKH